MIGSWLGMMGSNREFVENGDRKYNVTDDGFIWMDDLAFTETRVWIEKNSCNPIIQ